jgi:hypothetical protein
MCSDKQVDVIQGDLVRFIMPDGTALNTVVMEVGEKDSYCGGCVFGNICNELGDSLCPRHIYAAQNKALICSVGSQNVDIKFLDSTELI